MLRSIVYQLWTRLGSQNSIKIKRKRNPKKHQKLVRFLNQFGIRFLGARGRILRTFFVCLFVGSGWNRARSTSSCSTFHEVFSESDSKTSTFDFASIWGRFFYDMGSVLGDTWVEFCKHSFIYRSSQKVRFEQTTSKRETLTSRKQGRRCKRRKPSALEWIFVKNCTGKHNGQ